MKYIVNSLEAYSDSATPKIGVHTSAFADDGFHLLSRMIVIPLIVFQNNIDFKNVSASLLEIVKKWAQNHKEMNLAALALIDKARMDKDTAKAQAEAFAKLINDAIVIEKPDVIILPTCTVELLPIKVRPPVIEPIDEPVIDEPIEKPVVEEITKVVLK